MVNEKWQFKNLWKTPQAMKLYMQITREGEFEKLSAPKFLSRNRKIFKNLKKIRIQRTSGNKKGQSATELDENSMKIFSAKIFSTSYSSASSSPFLASSVSFSASFSASASFLASAFDFLVAFLVTAVLSAPTSYLQVLSS